MKLTYIKAKQCKNIDAWFSCIQCGQCGRVFEYGFMVDEGGTEPEDITEE